MIKNIIFDIGNVLTSFRWQEFYADFGYDQEVQERLADATVRSDDWAELDRGTKSDEEFLESLIENDPALEKELRHIFEDVHDMVTRRDYAIPWIESLKEAGYHCYYLSNFSRKAHRECIDALDFLEHMDGGILSYQDKVIKPDPEIYKLLLDRYHLKAEECVFLDDTEANLPPAEKIGMRTILFRDREQAVRELETILG